MAIARKGKEDWVQFSIRAPEKCRDRLKDFAAEVGGIFEQMVTGALWLFPELPPAIREQAIRAGKGDRKAQAALECLFQEFRKGFAAASKSNQGIQIAGQDDRPGKTKLHRRSHKGGQKRGNSADASI